MYLPRIIQLVLKEKEPSTNRKSAVPFYLYSGLLCAFYEAKLSNSVSVGLVM